MSYNSFDARDFGVRDFDIQVVEYFDWYTVRSRGRRLGTVEKARDEIGPCNCRPDCPGRVVKTHGFRVVRIDGWREYPTLEKAVIAILQREWS